MARPLEEAHASPAWVQRTCRCARTVGLEDELSIGRRRRCVGKKKKQRREGRVAVGEVEIKKEEENRKEIERRNVRKKV